MENKDFLSIKNCLIGTSIFVIITLILALCGVSIKLWILPVPFAAAFLIYGIVAIIEKLEKEKKKKSCSL
ncbi:hypothetical protein KKG31_00315 [Patescibacteria group bacterium]|nr:hypothetical protein [Patescibacteria group bacterium]MBU1757634.1 hypothetical protein [Patescibacteria group bacterium]